MSIYSPEVSTLSSPKYLVFLHKGRIIQTNSWPAGQNENLTQAEFYSL